MHIIGSTSSDANPIVLMHQYRGSAEYWTYPFMTNPNDSLPFRLADDGYDVWLPNNRGVEHYTSHESLSRSDFDFWAYSVSEMAKYDLPALTDAIKEASGSAKLNYVGFSRGSIIALASQAMDDAYWAENYDKVVHLAACTISPTPSWDLFVMALGPQFAQRPDIQHWYGDDWGTKREEICGLPGMEMACATFPDLTVPGPAELSLEPASMTELSHYV